MTVELRPLGVSCNIGCEYCYQNPQREAGNAARRYDLGLMKAAIEREGGPFSLFGGEPLLLPERDLEELWRWGLERFGANGIQTNGTLISDAHIRMFKEYRVHVGISIDGPGELNDARRAGPVARTRALTAKTEAAIARLCAEGIPPSLIITLHRGNAAAATLPRLHQWVGELDRMGVVSARLHLLESEHAGVRERWALSPEENIEALLSFDRLPLANLRFDIFDDMERMLTGRDNEATCIWTGCDPYTTRAVQGVEGFGQRSNCGRTNKEGIDFLKSAHAGFERYLALYQTPYDEDGCAGCRFFLMCKGNCPGTAVDHDWRNRTEHCAVWMRLFEVIEQRLLDRGVTPLSRHPIRTQLEQRMLERWRRGEAAFMADLLQERSSGRATAYADAHGDHCD